MIIIKKLVSIMTAFVLMLDGLERMHKTAEEFAADAIDLSGATITLNPASTVYTGAAHTPTPSVSSLCISPSISPAFLRRSVHTPSS